MTTRGSADTLRVAPLLSAEAAMRRESYLGRFARHRAGLVGAMIMVAVVIIGAMAAYIAPFDPIAADMSVARQPPSAMHWLGTDHLGRDILSRLIHGAAISLRAGVLAVIVGVGLGVPLGVISGYSGGIVDLITQRFVDTLQAFPGILLALLVAAAAGPNLDAMIAVLGILSVPVFARLVRGSVLLVKQLAFVEAARAVGCRPYRVLARHVVPNSLSPVIVQVTIQFAFAVLLLAGLGFLGLGAQPPTPEWGAMLAQGVIHMRQAPHIVLFPAVTISLVVVSLNVVGDALRDALDPRAVYARK